MFSCYSVEMFTQHESESELSEAQRHADESMINSLTWMFYDAASVFHDHLGMRFCDVTEEGEVRIQHKHWATSCLVSSEESQVKHLLEELLAWTVGVLEQGGGWWSSESTRLTFMEHNWDGNSSSSLTLPTCSSCVSHAWRNEPRWSWMLYNQRPGESLSQTVYFC